MTIRWTKEGKVDRDGLICWITADWVVDRLTSEEELADALDECVAALIVIRSDARYGQLIPPKFINGVLRKLGVEP